MYGVTFRNFMCTADVYHIMAYIGSLTNWLLIIILSSEYLTLYIYVESLRGWRQSMTRDEPYMNMLYIIVLTATEVTSVTAPLSPGLTLSDVQVGVATSDAEMCTDTVYCAEIPEANIMNHCVRSRTISLPQELNLCQRNYTVTVYRMDSTTQVSTMAVGDPNGKVK